MQIDLEKTPCHHTWWTGCGRGSAGKQLERQVVFSQVSGFLTLEAFTQQEACHPSGYIIMTDAAT